jgi:hypothetical protein
MTLIFNLWAIPVGLLIYLILLGIEHFFPSTMTPGHTAWTVGIVAVVIGALTDLVGIRGRLFLMPIWMIGLGIICYKLGWPGTLVFVALLIAVGIWFFRAGKKKEIEDWAKAQEQLIRAPAPPASGTESEFWEWVKATLFLPTWMNFTPELCKHNLTVLQAVRSANPELAPAEQAAIGALAQFLLRGQDAPKPPGSDLKLQNPVSELIEKRLRKASKEAPLKKAPPPLIPAT